MYWFYVNVCLFFVFCVCIQNKESPDILHGASFPIANYIWLVRLGSHFKILFLTKKLNGKIEEKPENLRHNDFQ